MITWHAHAGDGYTGTTDDYGSYHVDPVCTKRGRIIGYGAMFTATGKANEGQGLWQGVGSEGEYRPVHQAITFVSLQSAKRACIKHHKRVKDAYAAKGNVSVGRVDDRQGEDCSDSPV